MASVTIISIGPIVVAPQQTRNIREIRESWAGGREPRNRDFRTVNGLIRCSVSVLESSGRHLSLGIRETLFTIIQMRRFVTKST